MQRDSACLGTGVEIARLGRMRKSVVLLVSSLVICTAVHAGAEQTLVFFRHGEKPSGGDGQLSCQGLNRALALPTVLLARYGTPSYLYAPDPNVKITDPAGSFYYVRPLATIEPTVIRSGKSVNTSVGYNNIAGLESLLIRSSKDGTTSFIAWEHTYLQETVQDLMNKYGGRVTVPTWASTDFDSIYVVRVTYGATITAQFQRESEGLNGQGTTCPQ